MNIEQLTSFLESSDFGVYLYDSEDGTCAEVSTWTEGGVNMIASLQPFSMDEFFSYVKDFDVDEEIILHRQRDDYKTAFTMRESLEDFETFKKRLEKVAAELKLI